ncbi:dihydrodipicolinate synthase family protein [Caulobacter segnis]
MFPAATTQFNPDLSIDFDASQQVLDALIRDGVHGLVVLGTCGENNSLEADEKRQMLKAAVEVVAGRVPIHRRRLGADHDPRRRLRQGRRRPWAPTP